MGSTPNVKAKTVQARLVEKASTILSKSVTVREILFLLAFSAAFLPWFNPPLALLLGLGIGMFAGHPYKQHNHKLTSWLLQASVTGLGFGIDFTSAMNVSRDGFFLTSVSITATMLFGSFAGKLLGNDGKASILISSGTAICGGSAIAAIAPVIDATEDQASVALGTIFILNALALFIFPEIGQMFHMTQEQFGMWSAIAIHDTSSVVGAAGSFGSDALRIATTVKLARSLWIIPLAAFVAFGTRQNVRQVRIPWFIGLFVGAMLVHSFVPGAAPVSGMLSHAARTGLTVSLFLIGAGFSLEVLKNVGWRSLLQGILTWIAVALCTLFCVLRMY
ncbi:MAG: putative sulfate exporter family transporter [Chlorobiaceae bacterium]|nr:putative sulfate exporter family transporter [Chlorobiaceae bacterium]